MTMHLPQVERWTSNSFTARAAVELKLKKAKSELLGVIWFDAQGRVDRSNGIVTLDRLEITKARFPDAPDNGSNALAAVRELLPAGARTVSVDYRWIAAFSSRDYLGHEPHGSRSNRWRACAAALDQLDPPTCRQYAGSASAGSGEWQVLPVW
jgi:hypothetical protein